MLLLTALACNPATLSLNRTADSALPSDPGGSSSGGQDDSLVDPGGDGEDSEAGDWTQSQQAIEGSLEVEGLPAEVSVKAAFMEVRGDEIAIYLSSDPEPSCEAISLFIEQGNDRDVSPDDGALEGGTCGLLFRGDLSSAEGGRWESEDNAIAIDEDGREGWWNIDCLLGEGELVYEERNGYRDWFWSGERWVGAPRHWITEVAEVDGSMAVMVSLREHQGNYVDASALLSASGSIEGWFPLQDCSGLGL